MVRVAVRPTRSTARQGRSSGFVQLISKYPANGATGREGSIPWGESACASLPQFALPRGRGRSFPEKRTVALHPLVDLARVVFGVEGRRLRILMFDGTCPPRSVADIRPASLRGFRIHSQQVTNKRVRQLFQVRLDAARPERRAADRFFPVGEPVLQIQCCCE